jgi:tripartite-type tricarboxylate transporter receptor subunit TctC
MRLVACVFAALFVLLTAQAGSAQSNYPNRPVKVLVGFTPGTAPDLAARILADRFAEVWGTPFVVENVPGAGSNNRHRARRQGGRRWLCAADGRQLGARHQSEPV